jgi:hypothetical protein
MCGIVEDGDFDRRIHAKPQTAKEEEAKLDVVAASRES